MINIPIIYKFFKDFTNYREKTSRVVVVALSPKFLNMGTTIETFQQSGKKDSFRHRLKSSADMYESLCSQFLRIITEIRSGSDAFDKPRLIMTFLTIFWVKEKSCQFRSFTEEKAGKKIPESSRLESLLSFWANNFSLSDAEDNTPGMLSKGDIADLPLLITLSATHQRSQEQHFWEEMDSFVS